MKHDRGNPDDHRLMPPSWYVPVMQDFAWLSEQLRALRQAGFGLDPEVELVVVHPGIPPEGERPMFLEGCRAEYGPELGVKVTRRELKSRT